MTLAFLVALEALSPPQRAVLLLRDVYGLDVDETARSLALSEANVRVLHHRARGRLAGFDVTRGAPDAAAAAALMTLVDALVRGDVAATTRLFAPGVELRTDGGGVVHAARRVVTGADRVARGLVGITQRGGSRVRGAVVRSLNGRPALITEALAVDARDATRQILTVQTDALGRITAVYVVLAPTKLARVR